MKTIMEITFNHEAVSYADAILIDGEPFLAKIKNAPASPKIFEQSKIDYDVFIAMYHDNASIDSLSKFIVRKQMPFFEKLCYASFLGYRVLSENPPLQSLGLLTIASVASDLQEHSVSRVLEAWHTEFVEMRKEEGEIVTPEMSTVLLFLLHGGLSVIIDHVKTIVGKKE